MMKVLAITDKEETVKEVSFGLRLRWRDALVLSTSDGSEGIGIIETEAPDLVLADLSLKGMDSLDLIRQIREFSEVPLIMLSDQTKGTDGAKALEEGADDIVNRPFDPAQFLVRVSALLRRADHSGFKTDQGVFSRDAFTMNFSTREVFISGQPIGLTRTEYELLYHLVKNEGRVLTQHTLLQKVWGQEYISDFGLLRDCVYRLRKKLQSGRQYGQIILTQRGTGYRFRPLR